MEYGVSVSTWQKWEAGKHRPHRRVLRRIAAREQKPLGYFEGEEGQAEWGVEQVKLRRAATALHELVDQLADSTQERGAVWRDVEQYLRRAVRAAGAARGQGSRVRTRTAS